MFWKVLIMFRISFSVSFVKQVHNDHQLDDNDCHRCVTGGEVGGMLPQNVSPPKWGDAAHRDHPMEPTGEGGLAFCLSFQAVWDL